MRGIITLHQTCIKAAFSLLLPPRPLEDGKRLADLLGGDLQRDALNLGVA
jgi:hypothetical protein